MSARRLSPADAKYPARLRELADAPDPVSVQGILPRPSAKALAVVGSRRASPEGRQIAEALARAAAEAGVWIISGGAIGIDAAAHRGALSGGGRTVAVLGSPIERPSPLENRPLFDSILKQGGGWLSEQIGHPDRHAFSRRNRLIAALSDVVLVVEGRHRSGTKHTLRAAHQLGRALAAVTWPPGDGRGAQSDWVFAKDGYPIRTPEALLRRLRVRVRRNRPDAGIPGASTVDELAAQLGVTPAEALAKLTELELEGRVSHLGGGRYRGC